MHKDAGSTVISQCESRTFPGEIAAGEAADIPDVMALEASRRERTLRNGDARDGKNRNGKDSGEFRIADIIFSDAAVNCEKITNGKEPGFHGRNSRIPIFGTGKRTCNANNGIGNSGRHSPCRTIARRNAAEETVVFVPSHLFHHLLSFITGTFYPADMNKYSPVLQKSQVQK